MKSFIKITFGSLIAIFAVSTILVACKKDATGINFSKPSDAPVANKIQPGEGSGNTVVTVTGSGLGDMRSIVFESGNVPASFNPSFNTDGAVIFRVPDTANGGSQNIILTNSKGKSVKVSFKVIALASVTSVSTTDFQDGTVITLTGNNLESVDKVTLEGTTTDAIIVSKEKKKLVIKMPATTVNTAKLIIHNSSGDMTTSQVFVNVDAAYIIFKDAFNPNVQNWSWSTNLTTSTADAVTGTSSLKAEYTGAWGGIQLHLNTALNISTYKRVAFWIKGADSERKIDFYLNWANKQIMTVPANVWTYFSFDLQGFKNAGVTNMDTFIMQLEGDPKTFYLDNIIFIK